MQLIHPVHCFLRGQEQRPRERLSHSTGHNEGDISSVQLLSHVRLFATPCIAARQASLSITNSWSSLKLMPIESVMPSSQVDYLPLSHQGRRSQSQR